jgi:DNA-binding XRE family transcriptional regulator
VLPLPTQINIDPKNISQGIRFLGICSSVKLKSIKFAFKVNVIAMAEDINRLKVVLALKKRTNKWLATELNVNPTTVSKWCTNTTQPDLYTLSRIAKLLEIDIKMLLNSNDEL